MAFGRRQLRVDFFIDGVKVEYASTMKHLGVWFSENQKFTEHHKKTLTAMHNMNWLARNATHRLKVSTMTQFYNAYIQPRLDFASTVTYQNYYTVNKKYMDFFKSYWKFCGGAPDNIMNPLQRFLYNDLVLFFKWRMNLIEALPYEDYFNERRDTGRRSENLGVVVTKPYHTLVRKYCFTVRIVYAWLGLPESLRLETELERFKRGIKAEILAKYKEGYKQVVFDKSLQIPTGGSQLSRQLTQQTGDGD